jgi:signal transduction histidine kinase
MVGSVCLVFSSLFVTLNILMRSSSSQQTDLLLRLVVEQDGFVAPHGGSRLMDGTQSIYSSAPNSDTNLVLIRAGRFFYVKVDTHGNFLEVNCDMMFNFTDEEALELAKTALSRIRKSGAINHFQYLAASKDYGEIIAFAERSIETQMLAGLVTISGWVALANFFPLFFFLWYLSKWAVKPVQVAFEKQRRFISDASHELKTPLTILNANVDMLEIETGANERLSNVRTQSARLNQLIQDLLTLAKTDEGNAKTVFSEFDLSQTILNTALEFESRAFEEGKRYEISVAERVAAVGDKQQIRQLAAILIDNAIKHSNENGRIQVTLKTEGTKPVFSVYNTGAGIPDREKGKIFDRFYRSDDSRSRETGSYGLGLSIAKAIADGHKSKITVDGKVGEWVRFSVVL